RTQSWPALERKNPCHTHRPANRADKSDFAEAIEGNWLRRPRSPKRQRGHALPLANASGSARGINVGWAETSSPTVGARWASKTRPTLRRITGSRGPRKMRRYGRQKKWRTRGKAHEVAPARRIPPLPS